MEEHEEQRDEITDEELAVQMETLVKKLIPAARVAMNAKKALRRLSSAGTDMLEAALQAGTSRFNLARARNEQLLAEIAQGSGAPADVSQKIVQNLVAEQQRVDGVVVAGIQHVIESSDSQLEIQEQEEIADDWLDSFRREAADRSAGEMRETFARILAGEIQKPGTFSIKTLRTVGALSQSTAALFRRAASVAVILESTYADESIVTPLQIFDARIPSLGGSLNQNSLGEYGLGYSELTELTENGLLHPDYDSWFEYILIEARKEGEGPVFLVHQEKKWDLVSLQDFTGDLKLRIHGAGFTSVGKELLRIVEVESQPTFTDNLRAYFKKQNLDMVEIR